MTDGDGGRGVQQHGRHGTADDVGAADDHGVLAEGVDAGPPQHLHHTGRRAGSEAWLLGHQASGIDGVEAVHVLFRANSAKQAFGVDVRRKRQLDQDAVDLVPLVQVVDDPQKLVGRHRLGRSNLFTQHAELAAGLHLAAHVNFGRSHMADKNDRKPRNDALAMQIHDLFGDPGLDLGGNGHAVQKQWPGDRGRWERLKSTHREMVSRGTWVGADRKTPRQEAEASQRTRAAAGRLMPRGDDARGGPPRRGDASAGAVRCGPFRQTATPGPGRRPHARTG